MTDSCRAINLKVLARVPVAVGLIVELAVDAVSTSSFGTRSVSLTAKLSGVKDAHDKAEQAHGDLVKKIWTEAQTSENYVIAE